MKPQVLVLDDPAAAAAERIAAAASAGGHIALSGGDTPREAYEGAAALTADWSGAVLWLGDDRLVEPWDERSNYKLLTKALLDRVDPKPRAAPRVLAELGLEGAADEYDRELREAFRGGPAGLDLAIMGIGTDAHTASLFPDGAELEETERLAVAVPEPGMEPRVPRVTMTLPVFNAAKEVVFLVTGEEKAEAVARTFAGEPGPDRPASLVQPESGRLVLLCDAGAASRLPAAGVPEGLS